MDDNEDLNSVEDTELKPFSEYHAKKRRIIALLIVFSAITGIISCFLPEEDTRIDFFIGLPLLILGILWCFTDAAERNHQIGLLMRVLLILLFIVALPIYLFQTRGVGVIKTLAIAMVLAAAMVACAFVSEYASLFFGDVVGLWDAAYEFPHYTRMTA